MVSNFHLPPTGYGPGSQQDDSGEELQYMPMPQDMRTYHTHFPEMEIDESLRPAMELMAAVAQAAKVSGEGGMNSTFDLSGLDKANRRLVAETMGEGEVAMKMHGIPAVAAQESVFAGIWVLKAANLDMIEVGPSPQIARDRAFAPRRAALGTSAPKAAGVLNAPPLLVEMQDKSASYQAGDEVHVINLTLLPHTEQDLEWLDKALGQGSTDILSRGYGNCRVTATALQNAWRVQFFNSMDVLILDTFEVTAIPEVTVAAPEDLIDSGERLVEVLEAIR
ncbi:hydrogenase expression/formation protein [Donghicola tyrosinivorans]|uniref:Hydrogenase-1 operon protein HyaF n=1 Tax=Donghicola tyrosinivorans TaxID=1652492 RepID=A0A2T0WLW7_9RHOB|nr:hydrogenase expression/formation protein [Donghicola tyrosinivorans]PRY87708.1 hydrogenase-1 operon protein HyaF [Donghicola tyrosinivorans]